MSVELDMVTLLPVHSSIMPSGPKCTLQYSPSAAKERKTAFRRKTLWKTFKQAKYAF